MEQNSLGTMGLAYAAISLARTGHLEQARTAMERLYGRATQQPGLIYWPHGSWEGESIEATAVSLEAALADGRPCLCAGRFTAADVAVGYAVMLASFIDLPQPLPGSVAAYWQQLTQRPAYARAQAAQHAAALAQGVSPRPSPLG